MDSNKWNDDDDEGVPPLESYTESESDGEVPNLESYTDSENDYDSDEDSDDRPQCHCCCHCHDAEDEPEFSEQEQRFFQHLQEHIARNRNPSQSDNFQVPFTFEEFASMLERTGILNRGGDSDDDDDEEYGEYDEYDDEDDDGDDDDESSDDWVPPIRFHPSMYAEDDSDESSDDDDERPRFRFPFQFVPIHNPEDSDDSEDEDEEDEDEHGVDDLQCASCNQYFPTTTYSLNQLSKNADRRCPECVRIDQNAFTSYNRQVGEMEILRCSSCQRNLPCGEFSFTQWKKNQARRCKDCIDNPSFGLLRELMQLPNILGLFGQSDDEYDSSNESDEDMFFPFRPFRCEKCHESVPFWDLSASGVCSECSKPRVTYAIPAVGSDKGMDFSGIKEICIVCTDQCASTVITPCNHRVYCVSHARAHFKHNLDLCPLCREKISSIQLNSCSINN